MTIKKFEMQNSSGDILYPHTSGDNVDYDSNKKVNQKIDEVIADLTNLKAGLAIAVNNKTGSSLSSSSTLNEITTKINEIVTLAGGTADATATASQILSGSTAYAKGNKITGTIANKGATTGSVNAGGTYTIPAGYHNGSGKVTGNSLASQTVANATSSGIILDQNAWVNGVKVQGTMPRLSENSSITYTNSNGTKVIVGDEAFAPITNSDGINRVLIRYTGSNGYVTNNTLFGVDTSRMNAALGLTADKIVSGNTIGGISGTATISSMAKNVKVDDGTVTPYTNADGVEEFKITVGFRPRFAMVSYFHSTYNATTWMLYNYTGSQYFGMGKRSNNSTTTTYSTSSVMEVVSFVDDGVIVKANPYYDAQVDWIISQ